jgi:toxin YoeB
MKAIVFEGNSFEQVFSWATENPKKLLKILELIDSARRTPFHGIGKPELLKHDFKGCWSRRIDHEHQLVYTVSEDAITIISCKYHYGD